MYSNIFRDIHIDDRRMRKHIDDILTAQELVDLERMSQTWDDISDKEKETIIRHDLPFPGRPLAERDRPEVREPRREERSDLDRFLHEYHGGGW